MKTSLDDRAVWLPSTRLGWCRGLFGLSSGRCCTGIGSCSAPPPRCMTSPLRCTSSPNRTSSSRCPAAPKNNWPGDYLRNNIVVKEWHDLHGVREFPECWSRESSRGLPTASSPQRIALSSSSLSGLSPWDNQRASWKCISILRPPLVSSSRGKNSVSYP